MLGGKHLINYRSNVHRFIPDLCKRTKSSVTRQYFSIFYKRTLALYKPVWLTTTVKYVCLIVAAQH